MKKRTKGRKAVAVAQEEPVVAGFMNQVQQQLSAIEQKLDALLSQPSRRPFEQNRFQSPQRRFDRSDRHDRGRQRSDFGEKTFTKVVCAECSTECEIPFKPRGDRPVYCRDCFSKRKEGNHFSANRDRQPERTDFSREGYSKQGAPDKKQKSFKKKKSFSRRKKK